MSEEDSKLSETELRDRRRAKILASKDARMARITGSLVGGKSPSLKVDETTIQEMIAEDKKQAVELAKTDFEKTHASQENPLSQQQVHVRQQVQTQTRVQSFCNPSHNEGAALGIIVTVVSAVTCAVCLVKYAGESAFCYELLKFRPDYAQVDAESCRDMLLPSVVQILPTSYALILLPLVSDVFRGRKTLLAAASSLFVRSILFVVVMLISLRVLIQH
jgi:hypothetical protein